MTQLRSFSVLAIVLAFNLSTPTYAEVSEEIPLQDSQMEVSTSSFQRQLQAELKNCPKLNCTEGKFFLHELDTNEFSNLPLAFKNSIRQKARDMAYDRWPDGILEGPYDSKMKIRLDSFSTISSYSANGTKLIGYHVTYSAIAENVETGDVGRIIESAYVSDKLKDEFVERSSRARFVPNAP